ncbi:MAG: 3-dehydroquinate synthase [Deltaproteobacteria bacterium]|nr:3-dehydroquinate synthase [Deltaproteobacteria bacterium]MBT4264065.1 3-dehydroquinate synthase [Deltaproteobacteria bacterium]MBT4640665.1 3-dehydroquinate synthase [Deltaproteobacteria bacterium]MBT6505092.1 3-dehydroquinate synthase [Deltaproteobacteria bacterium]MBT6615150.1 3-dehydroquinate synthase [Deltaproteobacteria bacterium]
MKTIQIDLHRTNYRYQVKIGNRILSEVLTELLFNYTEKRIFVITNSTLHALYPEFSKTVIPKDIQAECLILPDGEQHKNLETVTQIIDFLVEKKANRQSIVIAFGGGVVGDISGFAASAFMRGISYVQIPTTLLSQVDSGIGGKTGINHKAGKNLIGAFKQPYQTIIDVSFLKTLPEREFIAGYAELIKHGIIRDPYLFQLLNQKNLQELKADEDLLIDSIFRSCEVKARVVEEDEMEASQRAILNFGHTFGHFLETYTNYQQLLHGEAVIIGMDFASWWSLQQGFLDKADFEIIHYHLCSLGISKTIPEVTKETFIRIVEYDKKFSREGIRFVGLTGIGQARIFDGVTADSLWDNLLTYIQSDALLKID